MGIFDKLFRRTKQAPKKPDITFPDKLMNEDQFWKIIETSKRRSGGDFEQQQAELADEVRKLSPADIILYGNRFRYFRGLANTWELWGAIYIIHGGCSDDTFSDFREWVIGGGKVFYYKTINDPESLVEMDAEKIEEIDWEGLGYVYGEVFKELTGQEMEYEYSENFETTGTPWREDSDDLKNLFPKLARKYPDHI